MGRFSINPLIMFSLNRAQVIGNVTRDPEIRQTSTGQTVASFAIATNRTWTDKSGQKQEKVEFHNIVVWGKLAEIASQYVEKGRKIYAEGRLQTSDWVGEDGNKRYRTEIVTENFILLDRSGAPTGEGAGFNRTANTAALKGDTAPDATVGDLAKAPKAAEKEMAIDDLPF